MSNSRYSISIFSNPNTKIDSETFGNSGTVPSSYEKKSTLTIGEKVKELLDKMRNECWVLNKSKSEYLLSVEINSEDEFIFNYMVRIGINQLSGQSFWFSWPEQFTGNITIHSVAEFSTESKRNEFVDNLLFAMNQYIENISNNWQFHNGDTMATNNDISLNTKNMICYIAEKLGIEIKAMPEGNLWKFTSSSENLKLLFNSFTKELTIPQTISMENRRRF